MILCLDGVKAVGTSSVSTVSGGTIDSYHADIPAVVSDINYKTALLSAVRRMVLIITVLIIAIIILRSVIIILVEGGQVTQRAIKHRWG